MPTYLIERRVAEELDQVGAQALREINDGEGGALAVEGRHMIHPDGNTRRDQVSGSGLAAGPPTPRQVRGLDPPVEHRVHRRPGAVRRPRLVQDASHVSGRRAGSDHEPPGDLLVGRALDQQPQHLQLARREPGLDPGPGGLGRPIVTGLARGVLAGRGDGGERVQHPVVPPGLGQGPGARRHETRKRVPDRGGNPQPRPVVPSGTRPDVAADRDGEVHRRPHRRGRGDAGSPQGGPPGRPRHPGGGGGRLPACLGEITVEVRATPRGRPGPARCDPWTHDPGRAPSSAW